MTTILFYDTETSGLPDWHAPSEAPQQPHIVQIAAGLVDVDTRAMIAGIDLIVAPEGWTIPDEVARVHGITTETAQRYGVAELVALNTFLDLWSCADLRVGHNEPFDDEAYRHFFGRDPERQHSAAADMAACMQIWFAIADLQRDRGTAANEALVDGNYTPQPAA